jgi:hypothetical protein
MDNDSDAECTTGICATIKAQKTLERLDDPTKLKHIFNNSRVGGSKDDGGSNENEQLHSYLNKHIASGLAQSIKTIEVSEMKFNYGRIGYNAGKLNKWKLRGRFSADNKCFQQLAAIRRFAAMLLNLSISDGQPDIKLFEAIEDKEIVKLCAEDLVEQGFKIIATEKTPWTDAEISKVHIALVALTDDPTLMGDYATVEKWLAWSVLGSSRSVVAVRKYLQKKLKAARGIIGYLHTTRILMSYYICFFSQIPTFLFMLNIFHPFNKCINN